MNLEALQRGEQTLQPHFTDKGAKMQTEKDGFSKELIFPFNLTGKKPHSTLENKVFYDFHKSNCETHRK